MIIIIQNNKKKYNCESYNLKNKIKISFELFPPKNDFLEKKLLQSISIFDACNPDFFSVTNSTNPHNRNKTFPIVQKIRALTHAPVFAHFTSVGFNSSSIRQIALKYWKNGIKNIIALRGDLPYQYNRKIIYAVDLIKILHSIYNFKILVAAYPEIHPESKSLQEDLINLKNKVDLGITQAITQFFFSIDKFLKFRDSCLKFGLEVDLIPGILPILSIEQLKNFSSMTNVYIPQEIFDVCNKYVNNSIEFNNLSVSIAVNLIVNLYTEGVRHFHLYTLNQPDISMQICEKLGLI